MEIYSFVDYDKKRKVTVPSFLGKKKSPYTPSPLRKERNTFSGYSKENVLKKRKLARKSQVQLNYSLKTREKPEITLKLILAKVGRDVSKTGNFLYTTRKQISIILLVLSGLAAITCGAVGFYLYKMNHVSFLKIETDDAHQINELMVNFVSENYGEYLENGDLVGEDSVKVSFTQPVSFKTYTVRSGDTVSGIAKKFGLYNISTLISVNNITNARSLYVGKKLTIPSYDGINYKVGKDDSLGSISKKFGIPVENIVDCNELDSEVLQKDQVLFLPGAKMDSDSLKNAMGELFMNPLKAKYRVSSEYGYRLYPLTGTPSSHSGIDLACPQGTPIYATKSGRVSFAGYHRVYGNYVIVDHGNGYQTLYGHMSKITCVKGQSVDNNTKIGLVGSTGQSTGPHLHFTVFKNGQHINPRKVFARF